MMPSCLQPGPQPAAVVRPSWAAVIPLAPFEDYGDWRQRLLEGHLLYSRILDRVTNANLAEVLRGAITTIREAHYRASR